MHSFVTQELARQHQEALLREAAYERISRHVRKRTNWLPTRLFIVWHKPLSESDFAAIRRDLRFILAEWCLESGTESFETIADTFMRCLRVRLGYSRQRKKTNATS
jgi:hypothetical protein